MSRTLDDLRRMYRLFADVKATVQWRGPKPPSLSFLSSSSSSSAADGNSNSSSGANTALGVPRPLRAQSPKDILRDSLKAHIIARGTAVVVDPEKRKNPVMLIQVRTGIA